MKFLFLFLIVSTVSASEFSSKSIGVWEKESASRYSDEGYGSSYTKTTLEIRSDKSCSVLVEEFENDYPVWGSSEECVIRGNFLWVHHDSGRGGRQLLFKGYLNPTQDAKKLILEYKSRSYNDRRTYKEIFEKAE